MQSLNLDQTITAWSSIAENVFVPHTEEEYERLVEILDCLIDQVGEDETHPLASLMEVIGVLIENYETEHIPELSEYISKRGHLIHKLKAKDSTGRWAYYFVLVESDLEQAFLQALESNKSINIEDYGKVVASCYEQEPDKSTKAMLQEKYGFIV
jgi:HTH-type transcriptional regulator / antitoxin HigA